MKPSHRIVVLCILAATLVLALGQAQRTRAQGPQPQAAQAALGTVFTYQGQLKKSGGPHTGSCNFQFSLWDAASGPTQVGSTLTFNNVTVTNGLFLAQLDFGDQYKGDARWLEVAVQCAGDGGFTTLSPRTLLTSSPYALSLRPGATISTTGAAGLVVNAGGWGVRAHSTTNAGVLGSSTDYIGVYGEGINATGVYGVGPLHGVYGTSPSGTGVYGITDGGWGVRGTSRANAGVLGSSTDYIGVYGESTNGTGVYGVGPSNGVYGSSPTGTGVLGETTSGWGVRGVSTGNAGVLGSSTNYIGVYGESTNGSGVYGVGPSNGVYGTSPNGVGVYGTSTTGYAGRFDGKTRTKVLEITGGSDLAERFSQADGTLAEPGTLMVADEHHPGMLTISRSAYDRKVVGIVSGAGDVKTGLTLHQEGVMEGDLVVAIAGRAYCKAEAHSAPIRPGDLLTSSSIAGHCMAATNRGRSHGAIVGKALTGLESGTGLVLVLVNLQ